MMGGKSSDNPHNSQSSRARARDKGKQVIVTKEKGGSKKFLKSKFLENLERCRGVLSTAAAMTNLGRRTIYDWRSQDEQFDKDVYEIQYEYFSDFMESKLIELAEGVAVMTDDGAVYKQPPNPQAVFKGLDAKAKSRGYGQQPKVAVSSQEGSSADGRAAMSVAGSIDRNYKFIGADGLAMSSNDFMQAVSEVASVEETKTIVDVFTRAREHIRAKQVAAGNSGGGDTVRNQ